MVLLRMDKMGMVATDCMESARTTLWHSEAFVIRVSRTGNSKRGTNLWLEANFENCWKAEVNTASTNTLPSSTANREAIVYLVYRECCQRLKSGGS